jgi:hypothetical protein
VFLSVPCPALPACLPGASGSGQAQAQSWSFTHPDTTASPHNNLRQTHPAAPFFCSIFHFPPPLGPLSRCHSRWAFGSLFQSYCCTVDHPPSPPAGQPFNRIPLPVLPEESGLLAAQPVATPDVIATRAMRPTRWSLRRNSSYQDRGFPALSRYSRVTT